MNLLQQLEEGLLHQSIEVDDSEKNRLIELIHLLYKWNKVYNLTAVRELEQMVSRHLLDSLSTLVSIADCYNIADLGSGGGFPGLPLAICESQKQFTLIDSNVKKTRFLTQVKMSLQLDNVTVEHQRVEELKPKVLFDCLISRAFASPADIASMTTQLIKDNGLLVLMMAHVNKDELNKVTGFTLKEIQPVQIFNEQGERHVVIFTK